MSHDFKVADLSLAGVGRQPCGVADRVWTLGDLLDAALATQPINPIETPAKRRSQFKVIQGDLFE